MPLITLPDGSQRQFEQAVTVMDVAADIGPGLAKATLAGEVDGKLVDGAVIGCFPNLYEALSGAMPDQVITL